LVLDCYLKIDKCTEDEYAVGLDRDTWGEAILGTGNNETACLARAVEQWQYCGGHDGEHVTAIYGPTGTA